MNLVGKTGDAPENWDKARKKDLTVKALKKIKTRISHLKLMVINADNQVTA